MHIRPNKLRTIPGGGDFLSPIIYLSYGDTGVPNVTVAAVATYPIVRSNGSGIGIASQVAIAMPPGAQTNDLLLMHVASDTGIYDTYSIPSGWTAALATREGSSAQHQVVCYRFYDGTEGSGVTFNMGASANAIGNIIAISGVNTTSPIGDIRLSPETVSTSNSLGRTKINIGRVQFLTSAGMPALTSRYDKTLSLMGWVLADPTFNPQPTWRSGISPVYAMTSPSAATMASICGWKQNQFGVSNALSPFSQFGQTIGNGWSLIINPTTLSSGTAPVHPYISDYTCSYETATAGSGFTILAPSGITRNDKLILIAAITSTLNNRRPLVWDGISGESGWANKAQWANTNIGINIWEKSNLVGTESQTTINYNANMTGAVRLMVLCIKNATSGLINLSTVSGVIDAGSASIAATAPLTTDAASGIAIYFCVGRGNAIYNVNDSWALFGANTMSGVRVSTHGGGATDMALAVGYETCLESGAVLGPHTFRHPYTPLPMAAGSLWIR
jgi:hypothetical protein